MPYSPGFVPLVANFGKRTSDRSRTKGSTIFCENIFVFPMTLKNPSLQAYFYLIVIAGPNVANRLPEHVPQIVIGSRVCCEVLPPCVGSVNVK